MIRALALLVFVAPTALAADLGELAELPEAEAPVEVAPSEAIDLTDEDDFEFEAPAPNAVSAGTNDAPVRAAVPTTTTAPTRASFAPAPSLPSLDHVEFEDDFEFEAAPAATPARPATPARSSVEVLDLEAYGVSTKVEVVEDARPALDGIEIIDDVEDKDIAVEAPTTAEELDNLLSDDDDLSVDW